ncbi:hypothetical protein QBC45DRAFT_435116 [Copromyces sp. CBS 386.78]|nr:hypothetical protein QBC45DRAFT_435116 [Copromyces sp. CBS 386.78]
MTAKIPFLQSRPKPNRYIPDKSLIYGAARIKAKFATSPWMPRHEGLGHDNALPILGGPDLAADCDSPDFLPYQHQKSVVVDDRDNPATGSGQAFRENRNSNSSTSFPPRNSSIGFHFGKDDKLASPIRSPRPKSTFASAMLLFGRPPFQRFAWVTAVIRQRRQGCSTWPDFLVQGLVGLVQPPHPWTITETRQEPSYWLSGFLFPCQALLGRVTEPPAPYQTTSAPGVLLADPHEDR